MWIHRQTRWIVLAKKEHPLATVCCCGVLALSIGAAASGGIGAGVTVFLLGALILGVTGILR